MFGKDVVPLLTSQIPTILRDNIVDMSKDDCQSIIDAFSAIVNQKDIQFDALNSVELGLQICEVVQTRKMQSSLYQSELDKLIRFSRIYLEAAIIADAVYSWIGTTKLLGQWSESSDFSDITYCDKPSGLVSRLYSRNINGYKEYIYATAGTTTMKDMANNLTQLDGTSAQYAQSVKNARELSSRVSEVGGTLLFTGHSLGGGEAVCNALATNRPAIVFNPAGVSVDTKLAYGLSSENSDQLITTIIAEKDPLTIFQDAATKSQMLQNVVPNAEGRKYYVHVDDKYINNHSMTSIVSTLKSAYNTL